ERDGRLAPADDAVAILEADDERLAVVDAAEARLEGRDERELRVEDLDASVPDAHASSALAAARLVAVVRARHLAVEGLGRRRRRGAHGRDRVEVGRAALLDLLEEALLEAQDRVVLLPREVAALDEDLADAQAPADAVVDLHRV